MNIGKSLEDQLYRLYPKIWDDEKISSRPLWALIAIPIVLSAFCVWFNLTFLISALPPFLSFFVVILISVCYGGIKGALIGIIVTTIYALALVTFAGGRYEQLGGLSFLPVLLYFIETVFFTSLLHRAQVIEKRNKAQYEDLLIIKNEIQEREKKHEDFVHMATHELKAPVTVLKAYLQLAAMKLKCPQPALEIQSESPVEDFKALAVKMNFQLEKLVTLINDLSESSRIKSGALNYKMLPFDIAACVQDCVDGFKAAHPQASINCQLSSDSFIVYGDESRLEQVVLNLLSNAVKYTDGVPQVSVCCELKNQKVHVRVKDQGLGIPEDMQPAVFDRFYRVNTPAIKKSPGLGLGLYICAEIIKYHQGEIGVESALNNGSTFWFSIPLHKMV